MKATPRPPIGAITVTVDGRDRAVVCDALVDAALRREDEATSRRAGSSIRVVLEEQATRLRQLAALVA